jgi:anthocyanidin 3-O-glucosyltransferase
MEGIAGGVPMISCPFLGDQRLNARVISQVWKIGVGFKGDAVSKENVVSALNEVLKGDEGKKMRERVGELKAKATAAAAPGGSSVENFKKLVEIVVVDPK